MIETTVRQAGVGLADSPWPDTPGTAFPVRHNMACVHPHPRFDRPGWCGFHIHHGTLYLNDAAAMTWPPLGETDDVPEGRWVRVTTADGRLLVPFELRRDGEPLEGRWLDGHGDLLPRAAPHTAGDTALHPERYAPALEMERWLALGGWHHIAMW